MSIKRPVYYFGDGKADGGGSMKELLGGKGANLAEMCRLGIPVPAGFTITTEVCVWYYKNGKSYPAGLEAGVDKSLRKVERTQGRKFGDTSNPLLLSVRSGARSSMPGMMETILNVGLTSKTIPGLIKRTNERFVYDAYRRLIMMYSDVVMEKAGGIEPKEGHGIRHQLETILEEKKAKVGVVNDVDLTAADLKELGEKFKVRVKSVLGKPFPDDPREQLWGAINAVFASWMGKRAIDYRRIERIPEEWGTAVNVQAMVFGNLGDLSSTGVAFTRNPATGENEFYGEYLPNAQGEDVVAGIRTPGPLLKKHETGEMISLESRNNKAFKQLNKIRKDLEKHFNDMLDIEFTIEDGRLWMLQCRVGKRNGAAAIRMAVDMLREKLIDEKTAIMRVRPMQLNELLLPMVNPQSELTATTIAVGLPAGPGGAKGQVVFTAHDAEAWAKAGKQVILVRNETSPEDVAGMHAAEAILTAKGGMTSHAALVARGWGKCCIVGCGVLNIDTANRRFSVGGHTVKEGEWITLNGTKGNVYKGQLQLDEPDPDRNTYYKKLMKLAAKHRQIAVRANADSGPDSTNARHLGAEGIGLCRTEHMFFDSERITAVREMMVAQDADARRKAIMKLLPYQRKDFLEIFTAMKGLPVTIRLLDPPLHEFAPGEPGQIEELAHELGITARELQDRIHALHELNPMLGHRGCRLGITYPEITEMQARAIFEAAADCANKKIKVFPEIMVPLVGHVNELANQAAIIRRVADDVMASRKVKVAYMVGTMIELPRAALTANEIAKEAEFFSFGTNDLTQTTFGFSRDDIGTFLPDYLENKILPDDPFATLDQGGVGQLVEFGIAGGRSTRPDMKIGICGEHGGDPESVVFCHKAGMNYVSCSPFRIPIALFAAAQAAITFPREEIKSMAKAPATRKKAPAKKRTTTAKKAAPKKATATKTAAKKTTARKPAAKKATTAKKTTARKPAARKATAKSTTARRAATVKSTAAKKTTAKKATARKPAAKKPAAKKPATRKATAARKPAAKKATTAKKTTARKPAAKKATTAKKTTARKPAAKKATTARKPAAKKTTAARKPAAKKTTTRAKAAVKTTARKATSTAKKAAGTAKKAVTRGAAKAKKTAKRATRAAKK